MTDRIDTLELMSIQHELAMNIGLSLDLRTMVRHFLGTCLRRLSVSRVHVYLWVDEEERILADAARGPDQTRRLSMPVGGAKGSDLVRAIDERVETYLGGGEVRPAMFRMRGSDVHLHLFSLSGIGAVAVERRHGPLSIDLAKALNPVFERLGVSCHYTLQHERILKEMARREQAETQIAHMAYHDDMTGLPNLRWFVRTLEACASGTGDHAENSFLMYVDLDRFHQINESLGYHNGDGILRTLAERFRWPHFDNLSASRLAGDAFVFLLSGKDGQEKTRVEAIESARMIQASISEPIETGTGAVSVSASIGLVEFTNDLVAADQLLGYGSLAMHAAKSLGRNTIVFYESSMSEASERSLVLDSEMRVALRNGDFELYLQPQVDGARRLVGAEALIRWNHPVKGLILPGAFIPHAEKTGFIVSLGDWVLKRACEIIRGLTDAGLLPAGLRIAVNLSASYFHQADFVGRVLSLIEENAVSPGCIELELTEGSLLEAVDDSVEKIRQLKARGVRFSIDDFGTGYSSLSYVKQLPVDCIKIDRAFVHGIDKSPDDAAIVETVVSMANHFQLDLIAEGVESNVEWAFLRGLGCPRFQGFLFHQPMPLGDFERLLASRPFATIGVAEASGGETKQAW